jgi:hypothetical protein
MARDKREQRTKKAKAAPREVIREERRLLPGRDTRSTGIMAAGGLGAALLGAGVYAQFLRSTPYPHGAYVLGGGALVLAAVVLLVPDAAKPILVGDAGVATEEGGDAPRRILWCDVTRVALEKNVLVVSGGEVEIKVPVQGNGQAVAWIVKEALDRIPSRVVIDTERQNELPEARGDAGEVRKVEGLQVTGRKCKVTGKVITYEPDARLCPRCGEAYLAEAAPETCVTCEAPMG